MKKILSIVLLFLFLITNSGMAVSVHWCCGELASVRIISSSEHPCDCGDEEMDSDCCKDKTTTLDANKENDVAKTTHFELKISTLNPVIAQENYVDIVPSANLQYIASNFYHPPPFKHRVPIYLLDRVFRI